MFEAIVNDGTVWKKIVASIKDLVGEANMECSPAGVSLQAMDSAHVALVYLLLNSGGFSGGYQCEANSVLGLNLTNLDKILKTSDANDKITLRHEIDSDNLVVECDSKDSHKSSCYTMKLMEIDSESMGIPDIEYRNSISIPSNEFTKICRDMSILGDTVTIDVTKEGVKFSAAGDLGEGYAMLRVGSGTVESPKTKREVKKEVKSEVKAEVKSEIKTEDPDDEPIASRFQNSIKEEPGAEKSEKEAAKEEAGVEITIDAPVTLAFALRYLNTFAKASALSDRITMHFAPDSPCMVQFQIGQLGWLRYYLAPKVDDGTEG